MKKLLLLLLVLGAVYYWQKPQQSTTPPPPEPSYTPTAKTSQPTNTSSSLQRAYRNRQSDIQVQGEGVVIKILPDDNDGSRHQKFIVKLDSGQTLLVAHNIDLAPRVSNLRAGDTIQFFGEYEWNDKGGVIHWTHHDPNGRHVDGWLQHSGRKYQ